MADEIDILKRALKREKSARKQAEKILEDKSRELFEIAQQLQLSNQKLEDLVDVKKSELQGVFDNLVDAYMLMDLSGNVIDMNDSAIELFGYDLIQERIHASQLMDKSGHASALAAFNKLLDQGTYSDYIGEIHTKSKGVRNVHINASLIKSKDATTIGVQGIVRDITDKLAYDKQRETLVKKLEKSNQELRDYAHIVSHDLKSPLRSMNALIHWIKEDYQSVLDNDAIQNLDLLLGKVDKMDQLIQGILQYSSIDKEVHEAHLVNIDAVVADIIQMIHIPNHIQVVVDTKLPTLLGNTFRIQQLFQNLIHNAIKYNDKKDGNVSISCAEREDCWEFAIADNGKGIPEKYHQKIFEVFQTLDESKQSTGVGLSIVKKIIDLYQGRIWIESIINQGTTFFFTLKSQV